ncbi:hypothetical protein ACF0H5_021035 [Mactra antiquata]
MDCLSRSLKDAQTVDRNLQDVLTEKRKQCKLLEEKLEKVNARLAEAQDRHTKHSEALKVEQHKVNQSQVQIERIAKLNEEKRQFIQSLSQEINEAQQKRSSDVAEFIDSLAKVAEKVLKAKDTYNRENLNRDLQLAKEEYDALCLDKKRLEETLTDVKTHYEFTRENNGQIVDDGIDRDLVLKIMSAEKENAERRNILV